MSETEEVVFRFNCPECSREVATLLVNDGKKIYSKAAECTCGWSRGEQEVEDIEILDEED